MRFGRRQIAGLAAMAAVSITVPAESAPTPAAATPPGTVHTVTLLTGDRVTFSSDGGRVSAEPGPGRDGIAFDIATDGGDVRVVPSDAGPLLAAGRLDERLFDVTGLVEAAYRLEMHSERAAWLSTKTDIAWTFRSGQTSGQVPLPLWTVGFSPNVDQYNSVCGGVVHAVPVTVTPQAGAAVGSPASLTVEASFDDGATWRQVPVVGGAAKIPHPRGGGFVSLRATAADSAGNTVTQTVIRAYRHHR